MRKPKIYLASKLHHSDFARSLVVSNTYDVTWTNRWQWFEGVVSDSEESASHFWENDFDDVDAADCVIVLGKKADVLKGALVEAGYAIAQGKSVYAVGKSSSFGTWASSQRVMRFRNVHDAIDHIFSARAALKKAGVDS